MHAGHLLLGRPWEFDRKVKKDGVTNRYSFVMNNKPVTLVPLTPKQVYEDQLKMKRDREKKMSDQKKREKIKEEKKKKCWTFFFFSFLPPSSHPAESLFAAFGQ